MGGAFLLLCGGKDFNFGIADKDEVELRYAAGGIIDSTKLGGEGALDKTWARDSDGLFGYTTMPTPGAANAALGTTATTTKLPGTTPTFAVSPASGKDSNIRIVVPILVSAITLLADLGC